MRKGGIFIVYQQIFDMLCKSNYMLH